MNVYSKFRVIMVALSSTIKFLFSAINFTEKTSLTKPFHNVLCQKLSRFLSANIKQN